MKSVASEIVKLSSEQIQSLLDGRKLSVDVNGKVIELDSEKVIVERIEKQDLKVLNDGTLTVGLDSKITDELKKEGYVRDLIRGIQNLRKESLFNVTDRIKLLVSGDDELKSAFIMFEDFIKGEVLAETISFSQNIDNPVVVDADDKKWSISVEKV